MSLKIAIIIASTRPSRVGDRVGKWVLENVASEGRAEYALIDLAEINLPFLQDRAMPARKEYDQASSKEWSELIEEFDGYILVTPEYNNSYPATLKNAIDTLYHEWSLKPAAFVGYGSMGGVRAISHLIPVLSQIDMVPRAKTSVKLIDVNKLFDEQGQLNENNIRGNIKNLNKDLI